MCGEKLGDDLYKERSIVCRNLICWASELALFFLPDSLDTTVLQVMMTLETRILPFVDKSSSSLLPKYNEAGKSLFLSNDIYLHGMTVYFIPGQETIELDLSLLNLAFKSVVLDCYLLFRDLINCL